MPTIPTMPVSTEVDDVEIDLTDPTALDELLDARHARLFGQDHILEWLRSSGGTLAERIMKQAAADLIEQQRAPLA